MRRRSSVLTAPSVRIQFPSSTRERSALHSEQTEILTLVAFVSRAIRRVSSVRANSGRRFDDSRTSLIASGDSRLGSSRPSWRAISSMMSSTSSKKSMLPCERWISSSTWLGVGAAGRRWSAARPARGPQPPWLEAASTIVGRAFPSAGAASAAVGSAGAAPPGPCAAGPPCRGWAAAAAGPDGCPGGGSKVATVPCSARVAAGAAPPVAARGRRRRVRTAPRQRQIQVRALRTQIPPGIGRRDDPCLRLSSQIDSQGFARLSVWGVQVGSRVEDVFVKVLQAQSHVADGQLDAAASADAVCVPVAVRKSAPPIILGCTIFSGAVVVENPRADERAKSLSNKIQRAPADQRGAGAVRAVAPNWSVQLIWRWPTRAATSTLVWTVHDSTAP